MDHLIDAVTAACEVLMEAGMPRDQWLHMLKVYGIREHSKTETLSAYYHWLKRSRSTWPARKGQTRHIGELNKALNLAILHLAFPRGAV